jgi:hypothetical protein
MKVLIIRDPLSDAIKKEAENLVKIGFFRHTIIFNDQYQCSSDDLTTYLPLNVSKRDYGVVSLAKSHKKCQNKITQKRGTE